MSNANIARIPRLGWILAVVLVVAAASLWTLRSRGPAVDYSLGGPLFAESVDEIEGLLLTRGGAQYRIDRGETGAWVLTGAVTDFVNGPALEKLLGELEAAQGGPLLPGTEPEDRRYDFYGAQAIRLTVFGASGERTTLALGATNPVTGMVYASGAGRSACFPVRAELRRRLTKLPDAIRARSLLPEFRFQDVDGIEIGGQSTPTRLLRHDERWWLHLPDADYAVLDRNVADYQALYADRRLERADGVWVLADFDAVNNLMNEIATTLVRGYVAPAEAAANSESWGLDAPYRRVILTGEGLNPDERYGEADRLVIDFGPSLDGETAPVRRLENVLLTDETALRSLELPVSDLAFERAADFPVILADSVRVRFEGETILAGHRDPDLFADILAGKGGDLDRVEGRRSWLRDYPVPAPKMPGGPVSHVRLRSLVVEFERIPILAVLPPAGDEPPFRARGRCRVDVFGATKGETRTLEFGWLDRSRLPEGTIGIASDESGEPAGVWAPATGQLFLVPSEILVTMRNLSAVR